MKMRLVGGILIVCGLIFQGCKVLEPDIKTGVMIEVGIGNPSQLLHGEMEVRCFVVNSGNQRLLLDQPSLRNFSLYPVSIGPERESLKPIRFSPWYSMGKPARRWLDPGEQADFLMKLKRTGDELTFGSVITYKIPAGSIMVLEGRYSGKVFGESTNVKGKGQECVFR